MTILSYQKSIPSDIKTELSTQEAALKKIDQQIFSTESPYFEELCCLRIDQINSAKNLEDILSTSKNFSEACEHLLVLGIGGSYAGTQALSELLTQGARKQNTLIYAGHNLDTEYHKDLTEYLADKDFAINLISKSGSSTEVLTAFEHFRGLLENRIGAEKAKQRILITTTPNSSLYKYAHEKDYKSLRIPEKLSGRYSVFSAVGLFPLAYAKIDIQELLSGFRDMDRCDKKAAIPENEIYIYAALRNILYKRNFLVELLALPSAKFQSFGEWWKQLFAESEGKNGRGILPITCQFTKDLHSLWQFIQDGTPILFQSILSIDEIPQPLIPIKKRTDFPQLTKYIDKSMHAIHTQTVKDAGEANQKNRVPYITLRIPQLTGYHMGKLIYFFEKSCIISACLAGIDPFTQPHVDTHKSNYSI